MFNVSGSHVATLRLSRAKHMARKGCVLRCTHRVARAAQHRNAGRRRYGRNFWRSNACTQARMEQQIWLMFVHVYVFFHGFWWFSGANQNKVHPSWNLIILENFITVSKATSMIHPGTCRFSHLYFCCLVVLVASGNHAMSLSGPRCVVNLSLIPKFLPSRFWPVLNGLPFGHVLHVRHWAIPKHQLH